MNYFMLNSFFYHEINFRKMYFGKILSISSYFDTLPNPDVLWTTIHELWNILYNSHDNTLQCFKNISFIRYAVDDPNPMHMNGKLIFLFCFR